MTILIGFGGGLATKQTLLEIDGHTVRNLRIDPPRNE